MSTLTAALVCSTLEFDVANPEDPCKFEANGKKGDAAGTALGEVEAGDIAFGVGGPSNDTRVGKVKLDAIWVGGVVFDASTAEAAPVESAATLASVEDFGIALLVEKGAAMGTLLPLALAVLPFEPARLGTEKLTGLEPLPASVPSSSEPDSCTSISESDIRNINFV